MLPQVSIPNNPIAKLVPLSTGLLSLIIYWATIIPEIEWGDSAELSLQADQLGATQCKLKIDFNLLEMVGLNWFQVRRCHKVLTNRYTCQLIS